MVVFSLSARIFSNIILSSTLEDIPSWLGHRQTVLHKCSPLVEFGEKILENITEIIEKLAFMKKERVILSYFPWIYLRIPVDNPGNTVSVTRKGPPEIINQQE